MSHFEILAPNQLWTYKTYAREIKSVSLANTRLGVSVLDFLFSLGDTRRYLVSRIVIQPVCLYSSVLFAILFLSLCQLATRWKV